MTTVVNGVDDSTKLAEVDAAKQKANEQFKRECFCVLRFDESTPPLAVGHYDKAQTLYTDAINCAEKLTGDEPRSAALTKQLSILYANRSIAYLRSELYGYALDDADRSIQVRSDYRCFACRRHAIARILTPRTSAFVCFVGAFGTLQKARPCASLAFLWPPGYLALESAKN